MNNSKKVWNVIAIIAIVIAVILGINLYNKNTSYANVVQNDNNKAFYEVVDRIQNSKIYLAKSMKRSETWCKNTYGSMERNRFSNMLFKYGSNRKSRN